MTRELPGVVESPLTERSGVVAPSPAERPALPGPPLAKLPGMAERPGGAERPGVAERSGVAERPGVPESPFAERGGAGTTGGFVGEPEWRARLQAGIERSMRQRAARAQHRRALTARRQVGLQTRLAIRLARLDAEATDDP